MADEKTRELSLGAPPFPTTSRTACRITGKLIDIDNLRENERKHSLGLQMLVALQLPEGLQKYHAPSVHIRWALINCESDKQHPKSKSMFLLMSVGIENFK